MVIVEKTPTCLKLRHRPDQLWLLIISGMIGVPVFFLGLSAIASWVLYLWWLPLFFLGLIMSSLIVITTMGKTQLYTFDTVESLFTLEQHNWLKTHCQRYYLTDIVDIQLEATAWHQDASKSTQIALLFREGNSLILAGGSALSRHKQLELINLLRSFLKMSPYRI